MAHIVVERVFDAPVDYAEFERMAEEKSWCFETNDVRRVESLVSNDGLRITCVFEAPDADAVRRAHDTGGFPYTTIWVGSRVVIEGD